MYVTIHTYKSQQSKQYIYIYIISTCLKMNDINGAFLREEAMRKEDSGVGLSDPESPTLYAACPLPT